MVAKAKMEEARAVIDDYLDLAAIAERKEGGPSKRLEKEMAMVLTDLVKLLRDAGVISKRKTSEEVAQIARLRGAINGAKNGPRGKSGASDAKKLEADSKKLTELNNANSDKKKVVNNPEFKKLEAEYLKK